MRRPNGQFGARDPSAAHTAFLLNALGVQSTHTGQPSRTIPASPEIPVIPSEGGFRPDHRVETRRRQLSAAEKFLDSLSPATRERDATEKFFS